MRVLSCTYFTICDVIHLIIRSSVCVGALSPTGYEPSCPLSAAFCVYMSLSLFIWAYLSHLSHLCLSRFLVGNYLRPFKFFGGELSAPIWVFSRDLSVFLRWSALRSVSALYLSSVGLVELWLLALHPSLCLMCWDLSPLRHIHSFCWWEDHQTLHWLIFISSPSPPSFTAPFDVLFINRLLSSHSLSHLGIHFV